MHQLVMRKIFGKFQKDKNKKEYIKESVNRDSKVETNLKNKNISLEKSFLRSASGVSLIALVITIIVIIILAVIALRKRRKWFNRISKLCKICK